MTQPQHPFTDLPEGAVVRQDGVNWRIESGNTEVWVEPKKKGYVATMDLYVTCYEGPTPNEAFQALRAAVREMANDLGVV